MSPRDETGWNNFIQFVEARGTLLLSPVRDLVDLAEIFDDNSSRPAAITGKGEQARKKGARVGRGERRKEGESRHSAC
jgi:hypothetical protein